MKTKAKISETEKEDLYSFLKKEANIDMNYYREEFILRRYGTRAENLGFKNISEYLKYAINDPKEKEIAKNRLFIPTTEFFRNREVYKKLFEILKEDRFFMKLDKIIAVSSPSSTGEEALSLALILNKLKKDFLIFAIDININYLKKVKKETHNIKKLSPLYKNEIKRYFNCSDKDFLWEDFVKRIFPVKSNLIENLPLKFAHLILMRNFFIYLKEEAQKSCLSNVKKVIKENGILVLGKVERVNFGSKEWEALDAFNRIYRFKGV